MGQFLHLQAWKKSFSGWLEKAKKHNPQLDNYITFWAKREEVFYHNISRARVEICKKEGFSS